MKFIKENRITIVLIMIFLLLFILGVEVKNYFFVNEAKDKLGNRIKDIEDYPISESVYKKIETEIEKLDKVSSVERAKGTLDSKVIDYLIVVKGETTIEQAKEIGDKLLTYFDEKTLSYYSVQIFISKKDTSMNNFPIIGMKNPKTPKIIWTKDRDITKETDEDEK